MTSSKNLWIGVYSIELTIPREIQLPKQGEEGEVQNGFNEVGHLLVCKQSKRGWEAQIFCDVTTI
jgi:hypothetical protein